MRPRLPKARQSGRWFGLAGLALLFLRLSAGAAPGRDLVLADGGQSDYVIVVPDGADLTGRWSQVGKAATLLQELLEEAAGAKLPVVRESARPAGNPGIYLGATEAAAHTGIEANAIRGRAFVKRASGLDLFLLGLDRPSNIERQPHHAHYGTLKAVTSFLEGEVGVRFLLPGPNGLFVPRLERVAVAADLNVQGTPAIGYCTSRPQDPNYDMANNYFPSGDLYKTYGGHSYYDAVPKAKYADTNPEYFAMIGSVRSPAQNHLCISNARVQELMLAEMEKWLDAGYEWVQLAQTDGYRACECEECRKIHPDEGERLWLVHRKLAAEMQKRRPGKKIVLLSYGPTVEPPTTFARFPDNVVIELCNYSPESFAKWEKFANSFLVYIYNWGTYQTLGFAPKRTPAFVGEQARFFLANNVRGIYKCGFGENLGLEGPVYYVYGKMLGDPERDPVELANDFYRAAYGKARAPMQRFFEDLYERLELYSALGKMQRSGLVKKPLMPRLPEDMVSYFFPPKLILSMAGNLERAKALAADEDARVQARIRLVEREFAYVRNLASVFYYYHAYRLHPDWNTFDLLAATIAERNALIDSWYDDTGRIVVEDGWPRFFGNPPKEALRTGGRLTGTLSAPFNWDVALLRQKNVLPGVGKKTLKIPQLTGAVTLDGVPDEAAWQQVAPEELGEIGLGALKEATSFRAAYDAEALYFGFSCQLSSIAKVTVKPCGDDGPCWSQECLEVFIDPFGSREHYYHFIFNPVAGSRFDERMGFISDPIDPMYGKGDRSWNGAWQYAAKMDRDAKRWTAEMRIPFAVLGVPAPKPGTAWTMNIGREHYVPESPTKELELSLWSPNLEARAFGALHAFGDIVFE